MSLHGYGPPPKLGEFGTFAPTPPPAEPESAGAGREEALAPGETLCGVCIHAPVCAVAASIKLVGGEGSIVVSACPAFESLPPGEELEPAG